MNRGGRYTRKTHKGKATRVAWTKPRPDGDAPQAPKPAGAGQAATPGAEGSDTRGGARGGTRGGTGGAGNGGEA